MQKEHGKNRDLQDALHNIQGPLPTLDNNKKDKKKNMFCHFIKENTLKQRNPSLTDEELRAIQKLYAQKSNVTSDAPVSLADVPFLDTRESRKDSLKVILNPEKVHKKKTEFPHKKDQKATDWTEGPFLLAKQPSNTAVTLHDTHEKRDINRRIEDTTDNQDTLFEVKAPTSYYQPVSERMLPHLPTDGKVDRLVEGKADVAQSAYGKHTEKGSQSPNTTANKGGF